MEVKAKQPLRPEYRLRKKVSKRERGRTLDSIHKGKADQCSYSLIYLVRNSSAVA